MITIDSKILQVVRPPSFYDPGLAKYEFLLCFIGSRGEYNQIMFTDFETEIVSDSEPINTQSDIISSLPADGYKIYTLRKSDVLATDLEVFDKAQYARDFVRVNQIGSDPLHKHLAVIPKSVKRKNSKQSDDFEIRLRTQQIKLFR